MPFTNAGKNAMLNHLSSLGTFASLHTAAPGQTGANELTGGSYARVALTYTTSTTGQITITGPASLNVPAGQTVTHVGVFTLASGGTCHATADIPDEAFGADGTINLTGLTLTIND